MKVSIEEEPRVSSRKPAREGFLDRTCRKALFERLKELEQAKLTIRDPRGIWTFGMGNELDVLQSTIEVNNPGFYRRVALGGSMGAAESYMDGEWTSEDLVDLLRIFVRNIGLTDRMEGGAARFAMALARLYHALRKNSLRGSRNNIHAHYDLGNDFFSLFLDETLTYSAGIFPHPESSLREASVEKLDRICRKLDLGPGDRVMEIGTGWGSFAIHAAKHYGCRVITTTLSREQYELAGQRVARQGLSNRIDLLLSDYRDLRGQYDKLVSIEMIEAVGHEYLDTFLAQCSRLLKPEGSMLIQAITFPDQRYSQYLRTVDFTRKYIFPGSCLVSLARLLQALGRSTDLRLFHLEDITDHYARTLREWRERFMNRLSQVRALGYPERFIRMWEFYLAFCEAGFSERYLGDVQMVLTKPGSRLKSILPRLGAGPRVAEHESPMA